MRPRPDWADRWPPLRRYPQCPRTRAYHARMNLIDGVILVAWCGVVLYIASFAF